MIIDAGSDIMIRNKEGDDALQIALKEQEALVPENKARLENYNQIIKILKNVKRMREILNDCGLQDLMENFMKKKLYTDLFYFASLEDETLRKEYCVGLGPLYRLGPHLKILREELAMEEKIASEVSQQKPLIRLDIKRESERIDIRNQTSIVNIDKKFEGWNNTQKTEEMESGKDTVTSSRSSPMVYLEPVRHLDQDIKEKSMTINSAPTTPAKITKDPSRMKKMTKNSLNLDKDTDTNNDSAGWFPM